MSNPMTSEEWLERDSALHHLAKVEAERDELFARLERVTRERDKARRLALAYKGTLEGLRDAVTAILKSHETEEKTP